MLKFVEEILRFEQVDERTRRSVIHKLIPRLEEADIQDPNEIYERVTHWIERRGGYRERSNILHESTSLERPPTFESPAASPLQLILQQEEES